MGGPRTLGELAAAEQVRPPTMTKLVQELEREGLASRERDADDARVVRVRSTAKGQRILQRGREMRITELESRLRGLDADELATVERAVGIIERVVRDGCSGAQGRSRRDTKLATCRTVSSAASS